MLVKDCRQQFSDGYFLVGQFCSVVLSNSSKLWVRSKADFRYWISRERFKVDETRQETFHAHAVGIALHTWNNFAAGQCPNTAENWWVIQFSLGDTIHLELQLTDIKTHINVSAAKYERTKNDMNENLDLLRNRGLTCINILSHTIRPTVQFFVVFLKATNFGHTRQILWSNLSIFFFFLSQSLNVLSFISRTIL